MNTETRPLQIGDRVRLKDCGAIGEVLFVGKGTCIANFGMGNSTVGLKDVELYDHKREFLTRLQSLLREFDAYFIAHNTNIPISVYFNDTDDYLPFAKIGKEYNLNCGVVVTAGNIMDYDK